MHGCSITYPPETSKTSIGLQRQAMFWRQEGKSNPIVSGLWWWFQDSKRQDDRQRHWLRHCCVGVFAGSNVVPLASMRSGLH